MKLTILKPHFVTKFPTREIHEHPQIKTNRAGGGGNWEMKSCLFMQASMELPWVFRGVWGCFRTPGSSWSCQRNSRFGANSGGTLEYRVGSALLSDSRGKESDYSTSP